MPSAASMLHRRATRHPNGSSMAHGSSQHMVENTSQLNLSLDGAMFASDSTGTVRRRPSLLTHASPGGSQFVIGDILLDQVIALNIVFAASSVFTFTYCFYIPHSCSLRLNSN